MSLNVFRRKEKEKYDISEFNPKELEPKFSRPMEVTLSKDPLSEKLPPLEDDTLVRKAIGIESATLDHLCERIDQEYDALENRMKVIRKKVDKLNLKSPEIIDLLNIYSKTKGKVRDFVSEIDGFDASGWGAEQNMAAFYKFRACKGLSRMKKQVMELESLFKQVGFTPSKVDEILKTPAEKLVEDLIERKKK